MGTDVNSCALCYTDFDDSRCVVQCTKCNRCFYNKCVNIDIRGFHMKKANWKCEKCPEVASSLQISTGAVPKNKRPRNDKDGLEFYSSDDIMSLLHSLVNSVQDLKLSMKELLIENKLLKEEIRLLKNAAGNKNIKSTYSEVADSTLPFSLSWNASTLKKSATVTNNANAPSKCSSHLKNVPFHFGDSNRSYVTQQLDTASANIPVATKPSKTTTSNVSSDQPLVSDNASDGFKKVTYKKTSRIYLKGTDKLSTSLLKATVRKAFVYVGNLNPSTSKENVLKHLVSKFPNENFEIEALPKKEVAKSIAFKVIVNSNIFSLMMNNELWPEGVIIKKFYTPSKNVNRPSQVKDPPVQTPQVQMSSPAAR